MMEVPEGYFIVMERMVAGDVRGSVTTRHALYCGVVHPKREFEETCVSLCR